MSIAIKRVLVTGANKGIGLAAVKAILAHSSHTMVLMACRDRERGRAARAQLLASQPGWDSRLELLALDVTSEESVRQLRAALADSFDGETQPLYGLVNNAGIGLGDSPMAPVLDVNLWGMCRVSGAMADLLTDGGRIVNVTSAAGPNFVSGCVERYRRRFTDEMASMQDLQLLVNEAQSMEGTDGAFEQAGMGGSSAYGFSKACANLYTLILARAMPQLHVNACTPGFIETDLTRPLAVAQGKAPAELGMKSPTAGVRAIMHLLFSPAMATGQYFGSDGLRSPLDRYRAPGSAAYQTR